MANKKFGEKLRSLRNIKGYTQQQVADILKLKNKSTLASWEIGKSEPDAYTFLNLCKIYGVKDILETFDENYINSSQESITQKEKKILDMYKAIDKRSKNTIEEILELQYNKCLSIVNENETSATEENALDPESVERLARYEQALRNEKKTELHLLQQEDLNKRSA